MAKLDVKLHGNTYTLNCGDGQEKRLQEVVKAVDRKINEIAKGGTNVTENRLLALTCLMLMDELIESRAKPNKAGASREDEDLMVAAVQHLSQRVAAIACRIGHA